MDIKHDKENHRFFIEQGNEIAELNYKELDPATLDYHSTFVPKALRHKGIGGELVQSALNYALAHHMQVVPSCPFVKNYIEKHPRFHNVLKSKNS